MIGNQIHVPSCLARNFGRTSLRMKKASFHCDRFVKTLAAGMNYDWHYPTMYDFPMFASDLMPLQKIAVQHVFPNSLLCDLVAACDFAIINHFNILSPPSTSTQIGESLLSITEEVLCLAAFWMATFAPVSRKASYRYCTGM